VFVWTENSEIQRLISIHMYGNQPFGISLFFRPQMENNTNPIEMLLYVLDVFG